MMHINDINNFNLINFNNLPTQENELEIAWFIDRTPNLNIINIHDINNIRNEYFDNQVVQATQALLNSTINFQPNENDFIPFELEPIQYVVIETEVREINVSEEERDCPICFETREIAEISQLNCQHKFCTNCITQHIHTNRRETRCPFCRKNITHITFQNNIDEEHFQDI